MLRPEVNPPEVFKTCYRIIFSSGNLLTSLPKKEYIPFEDYDCRQHHWVYTKEIFIGYWNDIPCFTCEIDGNLIDYDTFQLVSLYNILGHVEKSLFLLIGQAFQILCWAIEHQFCGKCSNKMTPHMHERAMCCSICNRLVYPRISPCVIVLITRGEQFLLAHNINFPKPMFSTLAGFIEAGESVENALHREVKEEVDLKIRNISYYGSQPWPFPSQLMLGFYAEYRSGEIKCNPKEIVEASWFSRKNLPMIPPASSIAGELIRNFLINN